MSAPTPAPGDDRPREGYYPDPSIPGYVRYWNGAAWVPGTSRPAPSDGEPLAPPPGTRPAPAPAAAEETGPHFFDEDPQPQLDAPRVSPAEAQHGSRPEPATAWGADRSRQSGFGGEQDRRVSWGAPQGADPRVPSAARPSDAVVQPDGQSSRTDGTATIPPADSAPGGGTVVFRRPKGPVRPTDAEDESADPGGSAGTPGPRNPVASEGTMQFRALSPRAGKQGGAQTGSTASAGGGFGAGQAAQAAAAAAQAAQ
ncbi:DUF2510 domain-containing protein, partial [Streptomyces sp. NPDC005485]|uniref:DUF2510 domain-containing protein n=1 Tax=Streptomyces sp. NPDC005485 TaxID=3155591 RepID=UPI0033B76970